MISRNLLVSLKSFSVNFASEVKLEEAAVLHYTYPKFSDLTTRCDLCGCKPTLEDVKRCSMLEFNRDAFISVSTVTEEEVLHWSQERILWTDEALKLLRKGILTRIYAPMVVVHGLRESGVFSTVIASTQNFLSSVKNSNSSMTAGVISSRKIGHGGESQATARRILRQCFYFYSNSTSLLLAWKIFT